MTATRFSKAATIVLIAAWLAAVFFLWRTTVPNLSLPHLDPRDFFAPAQLQRAEHYSNVARLLCLAGLAEEPRRVRVVLGALELRRREEVARIEVRQREVRHRRPPEEEDRGEPGRDQH